MRGRVHGVRRAERRTAALAVAAAVLGLLPGARAEDPRVPAAPPPPGAPAAPGPQAREAAGLPDVSEVLRLSLREALRMALRANLRIQAGLCAPEIAAEQYRYEVAQFDTLLTAGFEVAHDEEPATSAFFGRDVVATDSVRARAGLSRRTYSGGVVSFLYGADRLSTDSLFVTVDPAWQQGAIVSARQPILRGAGTQAMNDIRRAANGITIAEQSERAQQQDVLLEAAVLYWGLAFAQEELESRRKSVEVAEELVADAKARLDAQVGTPLDVADAVAGVEGRRGDLIVAENARRDLSDRLRAYVMPFTAENPRGVLLVATDDSRTADGGADPAPDRVDDYARTALRARPEVQASLAGLANRGIDVSAAADGIRPSLDVTGRAGTAGLGSGYGSSLTDAATGEAVSFGVGLEFSMFLGRRAARAQYRQAEWARRQAVLRHKEIENQVVREVRTSLRDIAAARARIAAGGTEVAAAREGLAGEGERLKQARSTPFRVLEKESELADARTREARAAADLRIAQARFWRAVGMLSETYGLPAPAPCLR